MVAKDILQRHGIEDALRPGFQVLCGRRFEAEAGAVRDRAETFGDQRSRKVDSPSRE
jgi:hypothetical protein